GIQRPLVQPPAELGPGLVDAGGVDEHDLATRSVPDAPDLVAGRLGPVGDDRDLRTDQLVEEGRLPHVGPAHQRGDARCEGHGAADSAGSDSFGVIRTVRIRRPWTRSARNSKPWNPTASPSTGTCPSRLK